jgi:hypothetical protein
MTKYLFFALVPLGILLLVMGVRMALAMFNAPVLAEISMAEKSRDFKIEKPGAYAIWVKAPRFGRTDYNQFKVRIRNQATKEEARLRPVLARVQSSGWSSAKFKLFSFDAKPGSYSIELGEGHNLSLTEQWLGKNHELPLLKVADPAKRFFQVCEDVSVFYMVGGILLTIAGGGASIAGLVLGLLGMGIIKQH